MQNHPEPIIIDCDPGQDDAVMLLMALASTDRFDIIGISTVAGNVPLTLTERNARIMCDLAGRPDTPVYAGCAKPMERELVTAEMVHGQTGLDGIEIIEPKTPLNTQHAVEFIIETLSKTDKPITLVPTGPLTNIATAIRKAPDILPNIKEIVLMGGAMREGGNTTPSAEFNILVDPEAAQIVFQCGRPITVFGLDVTHQVLATPPRLSRIKALGTKLALSTTSMLEFFNRFDTEKYGSEGAPLHDPCTIAYLLKPELFKTKLCNIEVETESELTVGHTAVDFWHVTDRNKNAEWAYEVDVDGFFDLLYDCLAKL